MVKATHSQPDVLTAAEARKRLRLGRNAFYAAISNAEVPSIRIGRRILIPRVALEALLRGEASATKPSIAR